MALPCRCCRRLSQVDIVLTSHQGNNILVSSDMIVRGGRHQRAAALEANAADESSGSDVGGEEPSAVEDSLLYKWAWGRMHATDVRELAHASVLDGNSHPAVNRIASFGAMGNAPQHIHKQLLTYALKGVQLPRPVIIQVPAINPSKNLTQVVYADCGCIDLHTWIHHLHKYFFDDFKRIFAVDAAESFWEAQDRREPD